MRRHTMLRALLALALLPVTAGCDQIAEVLELPNPSRIEAEGRAIGGACRHAGRSLEDCYMLNPGAAKAAVFAGWRDMNDYMMEHKLDVVPSRLTAGGAPAEPPAPASHPPAAPAAQPPAAAAR